MKRLFAVLAFTLFVATTAEATCEKCYWPPPGWGAPVQCGITIYHAYETCEIQHGYVCKLAGTCEGSGPGCAEDRHCPQEKWADGSRLPETARWVVATVEIRQAKAERERTKS
jgi:hypothetical protein